MGPPHEPLATVLAPQTGAMGLREQEAGMGTVRCWGWPTGGGTVRCWGNRTLLGVAQGQGFPGDTVARGSRGGDIHPWVFPGVLPDGPPTLGARPRPLSRCSEPPCYMEYSSHYYRFLPIFRIRSTSHSYMTTFYTTTVFFCRFVLQRNYYIRSVVLFEVNSILLLLRCLEASGWQFLRLVDKQ